MGKHSPVDIWNRGRQLGVLCLSAGIPDSRLAALSTLLFNRKIILLASMSTVPRMPCCLVEINLSGVSRLSPQRSNEVESFGVNFDHPFDRVGSSQTVRRPGAPSAIFLVKKFVRNLSNIRCAISRAAGLSPWLLSLCGAGSDHLSLWQRTQSFVLAGSSTEGWASWSRFNHGADLSVSSPRSRPALATTAAAGKMTTELRNASSFWGGWGLWIVGFWLRISLDFRGQVPLGIRWPLVDVTGSGYPPLEVCILQIPDSLHGPRGLLGWSTPWRTQWGQLDGLWGNHSLTGVKPSRPGLDSSSSLPFSYFCPLGGSSREHWPSGGGSRR